MPETRHELAVGESVIIDDYLLTVEDIRGEDVLFRIERIPGLHSSSDAQLPEAAGWRSETGAIPGETIAGDTAEEPEESPVTGVSRRSRPR